MTKNTYKHFPDRREEGKTDIEQTRIVLLRMLKIFNQICEENDINYWLDYGTLLGAIRYKGFIPLGMPKWI
jgi:phosphorylcholine metabolism protein LicD